ncbi:hypothetical protein D3C71_234400 [compost metagenome]
MNNIRLIQVLDEARHRDGAAVVVPSLRGLSKGTMEFIHKHKIMVLGAYDSSNANVTMLYKEDIPEFDVARAAAYDVQVLYVWDVPVEHKAIKYMRARMRCSDPAAMTFEIHFYYPRPDLGDGKK